MVLVLLDCMWDTMTIKEVYNQEQYGGVWCQTVALIVMITKMMTV